MKAFRIALYPFGLSIALLLGGLLVRAPLSAAPHAHAMLVQSGTCTPFVENQIWPVDDQNHLHVESSTFPHYQVRTGLVDYTIRLKLHKTSNFVRKLTPDRLKVPLSFPNLEYPGYLAGDPNGLVQQDFPVTVDFGSVASGWQKYKIEVAMRDPAGKTWLARINTAYTGQSGLSPSSANQSVIQAWPQDKHKPYTNIKIRPQTIVESFSPRSGVWTLRVQPGQSGGPQGRYLTVSVDPDMHATPPNVGQIIVANLFTNDEQVIAIDTTQFQNGCHKVAIRIDDHGMFGSQPPLSDILMLGMEVQN